MKPLAEKLPQYKIGTPEYSTLEKQIAEGDSQLRLQMASKRRELADAEARIYYQNYERITSGVKVMADFYKINLVLRYNSDKMDLEKPDTVIRGVMKNIVYHDEDLDMTKAIMQSRTMGTGYMASAPPSQPLEHFFEVHRQTKSLLSGASERRVPKHELLLTHASAAPQLASSIRYAAYERGGSVTPSRTMSRIRRSTRRSDTPLRWRSPTQQRNWPSIFHHAHLMGKLSVPCMFIVSSVCTIGTKLLHSSQLMFQKNLLYSSL